MELFLYNFCIWAYSVLSNYVQESYCIRLKSPIQSTTQLYILSTPLAIFLYNSVFLNQIASRHVSFSQSQRYNKCSTMDQQKTSLKVETSPSNRPICCIRETDSKITDHSNQKTRRNSSWPVSMNGWSCDLEDHPGVLPIKISYTFMRRRQCICPFWYSSPTTWALDTKMSFVLSSLEVVLLESKCTTICKNNVVEGFGYNINGVQPIGSPSPIIKKEIRQRRDKIRKR